MAIHDLEMRPEPMTDPNAVLTYMFTSSESGSTMTFKSTKTGNRYTFLIQEGNLTDADKAAGKVAPFFIKTLIGQDNESDFAYLGMVSFWNGEWSFRLTAASAKAHLTENSPQVKAFRWTFDFVIKGEMPYGVEVYPSIRCTRCNRKLTNPDQPGYAQGFGPDCFEIIGGEAGVAAFGAKFAPIVVPAGAVAINGHTHVPDGYKVSHAAPVAPKPRPTTPAAIIATVNEDAEIAKLAAEMWTKNAANPANIAPKVAVEPLPVDEKVAVALAKSQIGWTVADAKDALSKRRIVNLNLKPSTKVADKAEALGVEFVKTVHDKPYPESAAIDSYTVKSVGILGAVPMPEHSVPETRQEDPAIIAKVNALKDSDNEAFTSDGIMDENEAFSFWYRRFAANAAPVEG
jgi:hypothetical protein